MYFLYFVNNPLKKNVALRFNKIKFPLPKKALCQVRLKLVQLFLKDILNFVNDIFEISLLSPLGEGRGPSFRIKFLLPTLPTDALCHVWLKCSDGFREEVKHVKSL